MKERGRRGIGRKKEKKTENMDKKQEVMKR